MIWHYSSVCWAFKQSMIGRCNPFENQKYFVFLRYIIEKINSINKIKLGDLLTQSHTVEFLDYFVIYNRSFLIFE